MATQLSRNIAQAAQAPPNMGLSAIRKGKRKVPDRILLAGVEGVGKTTFAADSEKPIFIAAEDGVSHLDVESFPEPRTFADVIAAIRTLTRDEHGYRTLAIDTVDWVEPLVWRAVCDENGWDNIEAPGYGKGYNVTADKWRELLRALEELQAAKGMEVILLAHTTIRPFSNPAGQDYSRYEVKLHRIAAALVKEWTRVNLFAVHEEFTKRDKSELKVKGVSTGRRVMHTERSAAWDAKNRYNLPPELPLSYAEYAAARERGLSATPEALAAEAQALLVLVADATQRQKAAEYIAAASGDALKLAKAIDRLRTIVENN